MHGLLGELRLRSEKPEGIALAPQSRIPYNPRALSQQKFMHIALSIEKLKFAEEAGSR
jgi:hypothetical protein